MTIHEDWLIEASYTKAGRKEALGNNETSFRTCGSNIIKQMMKQ